MPDKIGSFLSGATTPMVVKNGTKKIIPLPMMKLFIFSRLKSYRAEIRNLLAAILEPWWPSWMLLLKRGRRPPTGPEGTWGPEGPIKSEIMDGF